MGRGAHSGRPPPHPRPARVAHRATAPDRSQPIVVYCESGNRSALRREGARGARLRERRSLAGGLRRAGSATASRRDWRGRSRPSSARRYSRHLLIPEVGEEGQQKLLDSRVLLIGAGGLGSPVLALPRGRGRRHARHRRRGRRRRDEPPAPDRPLDRAARRAEGALGGRDDHGAEPRRRRSSRSRSASPRRTPTGSSARAGT